MPITISPYNPLFAAQCWEILYKSVHAIVHPQYTDKAKHAWAPHSNMPSNWPDRLACTQPWLLLEGNTHSTAQLKGFAEYLPSGHIDCFYIHPASQRSGLGQLLYNQMEALARENNNPKLTVDASLVAVPFFTIQGFVWERINRINRNGTTLMNVSMSKRLA